MKEKALNIGQSLQSAKDEFEKVLSAPESTTETVKAAKAKMENRQIKFDNYQKMIKQAEAEQRANLHPANRPVEAFPKDPKERLIKAEAAFIRKTVRPDNADFQEAWNNVKQELKDDDTTKGGQLLPVNVSNQLVSEPMATNPLRGIESISTITNLILPKIAFEIADDGFVKDGEAAKEMDLKGDQIVFGRFQMKVRAGITDTVLHGTDTGLVQYVNNALSSAMQLKERSTALGTSNPDDLKHMSFYDPSNNIKKITGDNLYKGIRKALADLDDAYQDQAKILMTRTDYYDMIDALANGSTTLYQAQPESVLGAPVVFTSAATTPIVGDFAQARLNYEIANSLYEQYKDYDKGINYFQLTTWFDQRILLPSAFRLVEVGSGSNTGSDDSKKA